MTEKMPNVGKSQICIEENYSSLSALMAIFQVDLGKG